MLNWIVSNWTVFDIETVLTLNWIVIYITVWIHWIVWNRNVFDKLCTHAKLNCFELIIYIKVDMS